MLTSNGIERTPRMRSFRMLLDHYARLAFRVKTDRLQRTGIEYTDRYRQTGFAVDAFACGHTSHRGFKYCDVMRDGASQMIFLQLYKESGSRGDSKCVYQAVEFESKLESI